MASNNLSEITTRKAPHTTKTPLTCPTCECHNLIKKGTRKKKLERVQLWQCKACKRTFTPSPNELTGKTFPVRMILDALTNYHLGYSLSDCTRMAKRRWKHAVSPSTIGTWLSEYKEIATYRRLRQEGKSLYRPNAIIRSIKLYHRQVYSFAYHRAKLVLLTESKQHARFQPVHEFLEAVPAACPHDLFQVEHGARASQLAPDFIDKNNLVVTEKKNAATRTAALVIPTVGNNYLRHERLQNFMLANDSVTVAVEIPIWLDEADLKTLEMEYDISLRDKDGKLPPTLTGHIDFLQIRNGAVHILDYKPDAKTNKPFAQLTIYALALTRLIPGLKLFDIKCAWFNEDTYCEFFPRTALRHTQ